MSDTPRTFQARLLVEAGDWRNEKDCTDYALKVAEELERELNELKSAAQTTLDKYTKLADSGDAGHWNPEEETHVINLRRALNLWKE